MPIALACCICWVKEGLPPTGGQVFPPVDAGVGEELFNGLLEPSMTIGLSARPRVMVLDAVVLFTVVFFTTVLLAVVLLEVVLVAVVLVAVAVAGRPGDEVAALSLLLARSC